MSTSAKNFSVLVAICIGFSLGCGKKKDPGKIYFDKASEYNNYISRQYEEVNRLWDKALMTMDDSALVYKQLDSLKTACQGSVQNMSKLADFKGDTIYRHAAGEYFAYMLRISNTSFKEAIDIGLMDDMPDSLYFKFTAIGNQIGADKDTCINRLKAAQLHFISLSEK